MWNGIAHRFPPKELEAIFFAIKRRFKIDIALSKNKKEDETLLIR